MQEPVKDHRHTPQDKQRSVVVRYQLNGINVCKKVLSGTLSVPSSRLQYLRKKKTAPSGLIIKDQRGLSKPGNALPERKIDIIKSFLNKFPKYTSHYSNNNKQYFPPNLTKSKLYNLYKSENMEDFVSYFVFDNSLKNYNISFYKPKKDTCSNCDNYKSSILNADLTASRKLELEDNHKMHLKRASDARTSLRSVEALAKNNPKTIALSFDMEKTQPMPHINTSVAFYKRQLWLYNLGISNRATNEGTMCLWTEVQGKRGSNEVGSALLEYLRGIDLTNYESAYSFSDACGGQNRNKTIVALFLHICHCTPIQSWTHSFMESGHSYLPNDTDFGKIERKKKFRENIYNYEDWQRLIESCNFKTIGMEGRFRDVSSLTKNLQFRTSDCDGNKFSWLKLKWLQVSSENHIMKYKLSCSPDEPIKTIDFSKNIDLINSDIFDLPILYNVPPKISKEKFKDIQSLLQYIPPIYHQYFESLPHHDNNSDNLEDLDDLI